MVDGIHISTTNCDFARLLESDVLNFQGPRRVMRTNEVVRNKYGNATYISNYRSLFIKVTENMTGTLKLRIEGSLHTFKNQGKHNYDDFSYTDICNVIEELGQICLFDPRKAILHNLEIGVNITPPIETSNILNSLMMHRM